MHSKNNFAASILFILITRININEKKISLPYFKELIIMIRLLSQKSEIQMKITKQLIESMVREELASISEDNGLGIAPSGREVEKDKFSPDMVANLVDLVANIKNLVKQRASIDDVEDAIEQSEKFLKALRLKEGRGPYQGPKSGATVSPSYGQPKKCPEGKISDVDPGGRHRCVDKNRRRPGFFEE